MNVTVQIDELILRGMPPGQAGYEVAEALEQELARLLADRPLRWVGPNEATSLQWPALPPLVVRESGRPAMLGAALAAALYESLAARLAGGPGAGDDVRSR